MTNREAYFSLSKLGEKYLSNTVIKTVLVHCGQYLDFFDLLKHFDEPVKDEEKFNNIIEKIRKGEPYQYVLGEAFFISGNYIVTPDVLIPRQETEQLAIGTMLYTSRKFGLNNTINIADIGTGSGILAIYIKEHSPLANVMAVDISPKALQIAKKNAQNHNVLIDFYEGDMISPLVEKGIKLDVLVSNPPYIESRATIEDSTWNYEPHLALLANPKTKYYEQIITNVDKIMKPNFLITFEIGEDMEQVLSDIIEKNLPDVVYKFEKDMYNKIRFLYIVRRIEN